MVVAPKLEATTMDLEAKVQDAASGLSGGGKVGSSDREVPKRQWRRADAATMLMGSVAP